MIVRYDATSTNVTPLVFDYRPQSPLRKLQGRLQNGRLWWLGNRVSDVRYWLWRLSR